MKKIKRVSEELSHLRSALLHTAAMYCPYTPMKRVLYRLRGARIGRGVDISGLVYMEESYPHLVTIEDEVDIGPGVMILTHDSSWHNIDSAIPIVTKPVTLKKNSYIGACAVLLPGVTVGEYSVVAAGAVVASDVPPRKIVAGVPARIIGDIDEKLKELRSKDAK